MKKGIFLMMIFILVLPVLIAEEIPDYTDRYVNDFSGLFNQEQTNFLRGILYETEQNTTAQIVFVSVNSCSPYASLDYSFKIGEKWGVGQEDKDNGLVILYCSEENKIAVSTGYGLEGILPDSKIGRMLDEYYVPLRDSGNVSEGIINFTQEIVIVLEQNKEEVISGRTGNGDYLTSKYLLIIIFVIIITVSVLAIISKIREKQDKKNKKNKKLTKTGKIINFLFWLTLFCVFIFEFYIWLIVLLIFLFILRVIFFPYSSSKGVHYWGGFGGGGGSGGFGGGGFGGGGFGGGGAGR